MSIILDLIIVAIVAVYAYISAKKGFVRGIIEFAFLALALIIVAKVCTPLANATYDKRVEPYIVEKVTAKIDESTEKAKENIKENVTVSIEEAFDLLPGFLKDAYKTFGIDTDKAVENISSKDISDTEDLVTNISREVVKPIVSQLLSLLYSVIVLAMLKFVGGFIAKAVNKFFTFSFIGKLNSILGAIIGIPSGVISAVIFCGIVMLMLVLVPNGFWIFTKENIEKTFLFDFLVGFLPF